MVGCIGVTALLETDTHTLVWFGLRAWPADGSAHDLDWTLSTLDRGAELVREGGGFGGSGPADGVVDFDGGWWFAGREEGALRVRCSLGTDRLIDVDVGRPLTPVPTSIVRVEPRPDVGLEHRSFVAGLADAGWRRGRATADELLAIAPPGGSDPRQDVVPVTVERWGRLLRLTVLLDGGDSPDHPPRWWSVRLGGLSVDALCERAQSAHAADLVGHLVMVDPDPGRPLDQIGT